MNRILFAMGLSLFIMGCSLTITSDRGYDDIWIDNVRGSYDLCNAQRLNNHFRKLKIDLVRNRTTRIDSNGYFEFRAQYGIVEFALMEGEGSRDGLWAVYRMTYTDNDRPSLDVIKYVTVAISEIRGRLILGDWFYSVNGPSSIDYGVDFLSER